jgi:transcriptional regulator with XRE-family HTH domain
MHSKHTFKKIDDFFAQPPSTNQKAWGLIHDFYDLILNHMEKNDITKASLAQRLGKSRSAISQMLNQTPNITIKKMVEIAEAVGLDIRIATHERKADKPVKHLETMISVSVLSDTMVLIDVGKKSLYQYQQQIMAHCDKYAPGRTMAKQPLMLH